LIERIIGIDLVAADACTDIEAAYIVGARRLAKGGGTEHYDYPMLKCIAFELHPDPGDQIVAADYTVAGLQV
jgi:hypothetical protein